MARRVILFVLMFVWGLILTACGSNAPAPTPFVPTATLQGALVPTRVIPTQGPTEAVILPSDTPTETPTLTATEAFTATDAPTETATPTATTTPTSTPSNTPTPATPIARAVRDLMIRSGPGSQYPTLQLLSADDTLAIIGISEDGSWYQVQLPDGSIGWLVTSQALIDTAGNIASVPIAAAPTDVPTNTPTATDTPTNTPTATDTATSTPTDTPTATDAVTPTPTDVPATATVTDSPTTEAGEETIEFGDTLEGTIDSSNPAVSYSFTGSEGDIVRIRLAATSGDLDPTLVLLNAAGEEIARNDDESFTVKDAYIEQTLAADGVYTILATRYRQDEGVTTGTFDLSLLRGEAVAVTQGMVYGDNTAGIINDGNYELRYQFEGEAGDVVNIGLNAGSGADLDALLLLLGPDGSQLTTNDDLTDSSRDAGIVNYTLPENGVYTIVATRYQQETGSTSGAFTLTLDKGRIDVTPAPDNNSVSDTLSNSQPALVYTYTTTGPEVVTFTLEKTSGDLDPMLIVLDPSGREIIRNDDAGDGTANARISNLVLDQIGEYSLIATRYLQEQGATTGSFELSALPGDEGEATFGTFALPITYGVPVSGNIGEVFQSSYTFEGQGGDVLTINLNATSGDLDTTLALTDSYGNEIAYNDDANANTRDSRIVSVELPEDGYYTLVVIPYDGTGNYELWITEE